MFVHGGMESSSEFDKYIGECLVANSQQRRSQQRQKRSDTIVDSDAPQRPNGMKRSNSLRVRCKNLFSPKKMKSASTLTTTTSPTTTSTANTRRTPSRTNSLTAGSTRRTPRNGSTTSGRRRCRSSRSRRPLLRQLSRNLKSTKKSLRDRLNSKEEGQIVTEQPETHVVNESKHDDVDEWDGWKYGVHPSVIAVLDNEDDDAISTTSSITLASTMSYKSDTDQPSRIELDSIQFVNGDSSGDDQYIYDDDDFIDPVDLNVPSTYFYD